ncbi:hypothetical protein Sjap_012123 [Stephania japonica]|uniref:Uncharacterized protein n=1 Tax=Stephania japonica TaxID=461633 RepID=A0AAP0IXT6_9MAGN
MASRDQRGMPNEIIRHHLSNTRLGEVKGLSPTVLVSYKKKMHKKTPTTKHLAKTMVLW